MPSKMTTAVVAIVDAPFEEQISEAAAFVSRSRPEGERDAFIASFQRKAPLSSTSAAAAEGDAKEAASTEVPLEERRALVERLVGEVKDAGEGPDRGTHASPSC